MWAYSKWTNEQTLKTELRNRPYHRWTKNCHILGYWICQFCGTPLFWHLIFLQESLKETSKRFWGKFNKCYKSRTCFEKIVALIWKEGQIRLEVDKYNFTGVVERASKEISRRIHSLGFKTTSKKKSNEDSENIKPSDSGDPGKILEARSSHIF